MIMENPSYYGILPAKVRYDNRLRPNEKIMFTEITALSNKYGYCSASNHYFAKLYEKAKPTISNWVNDLKKCEYLAINYEMKDKQIIKRRMYPILDEITGGINKNVNTPSQKCEDPLNKNVKDNTTRDNTTRKNSGSSSSENNSGSSQDLSKLNLEVQRTFGMISPTYFETLSSYSEDLSIDLMLYGIEIAKRNNKDSIQYLIGIYRKWFRSKVYTLKQLKNIENASTQSNQGRNQSSKRKFKTSAEINKEREAEEEKAERELIERMENE